MKPATAVGLTLQNLPGARPSAGKNVPQRGASRCLDEPIPSMPAVACTGRAGVVRGVVL